MAVCCLRSESQPLAAPASSQSLLGHSRLNKQFSHVVADRKGIMSHVRGKLWACVSQHLARRARRKTCAYSNLSDATVYGGPKPQNPDKRITLRHLATKYTKHEPITMVTAYDYPSAIHVDQAGIDICLVGDSVGMVVHGHDTTLPVTIDDIILHCRTVARGAKRPLLVGDLPFGSYERSSSQAVENASRILKEGGMDAVKLEGGYGSRVAAAKAIVEAGIAVMGHVGLTPQAISALGGFRPQGQTSSGAMTVLENALALQEAGCFGIILECLPSPVAAAITSALSIPTVGIGAGPRCSGQVLVYHDLLGVMQHPHHAKVTPKFCKRYAQVGSVINEALVSYRDEVASGSFPSPAYSPYKIAEKEVDSFLKELDSKGFSEAAEAASTALKQIAEYNTQGAINKMIAGFSSK